MNEELKKVLVEALGISSLPNDKQEEMIQQIGVLVYQGALIRSMEYMSDEEVIEFENLTNSNTDPEGVFSFIKSKVENFEQIIKEEAENFLSKSNSIMGQIGE